MDRLLSMRVFRAVVEEGAFARAARKLRLSNAAVSKHVRALEEALDVRLLHRTTRSLALTPEGSAYFERAVALIDELESLETEIRERGKSPRGTLRVSAPMSYGIACVAPALPEFLAMWPEVKIDLALTDRMVDVVEEGVDVAIRVARTLSDSTLLARRIASQPRQVVGSPDYFASRGTPQHPSDLTDHACLRYSRLRDAGRWSFAGVDGTITVEVDGPLDVDNSLALRESLLAGLGVTLTPRFVVAEALDQGLLVPCLDDWEAQPVSVFAVYPARRYLTAKVQLFLDFLGERLV